MKVYRPTADEDFSFEIECGEVKVPAVTYKMLEDGIGYIRLNEFTEVAVGQFVDAAEMLEDQGMQKLIVDLRDNPGGLLTSVCDILDEVLPEAHVLVMALPGTPETAGVLSRERIALLPQDALVLNVGRGTAVDQEALMDALNRERIAGAALDVMVPEPLPQDHPLWQARNLVLTPHVSGNMSLGYTRDRAVEIFCENLTRYAAGEPLHHLVDRSRGY